MKKRVFGLALLTTLSIVGATAKDYLISTPKTSLLITATEGEKSLFQYYGSQIDQSEIQSVYASGLAMRSDSYPTFGVNSYNEKAILATHPNGDMSLDLVVDKVIQSADAEGEITEVVLKDKLYPFTVSQYYKAYNNSDVITTWTKITNNQKKPVMLYRFVSAHLPFKRNDNYISHLHGSAKGENRLFEEELMDGTKEISNTKGVCNATLDNPSLMITMSGRPSEETGDVFGGTLAWSGNYKIKSVVDSRKVTLLAGINEDNSYYKLESKESFTTPEFAMTYSTEGKGGVSRAFHKWARQHKLMHGDKERDILLNSWEGVYFDTQQPEMEDMMKAISSMGGELFVMDDGWFGNKYPRNDGSSSLGDWQVCEEKLPGGISGLTAAAEKCGIKFGIWIEPEMTNTLSELYEKHPDWVLAMDHRPTTYARGKTQIVLDLTNPKVQNFVFGVVDNIMTNNPEIEYIKWDANCNLANYGSHYLPSDKQSHIYINYHRGLNSALERIRAKYPDLTMQACASGGGRVNYGVLPYFDEFWTSDNTDALQRIYIQWGISNFFPSIAMASHISATVNHQTGRTTPLKFRTDVAMSGRLGIETQPKDLNEEEREFVAKAIANYKKIRPIVQFGELYRLVSPYEDKGIASLMYATESKDRAVAYIYKIEHFINAVIPNVKFTGLDSNKRYRVRDLTPDMGAKPFALNGKVISGKVLKESGIALNAALRSEYSSLCLSFEEVK